MAKEIKIGSIVHLRNGNNGYLDVRGLVRLIPDFWNIAGTERTLVFTHPDNDRDRGSGSWRIMSASGKTDGEPLMYGDLIHLKSMAGEIYLDVCGGVEHLIPFQKFHGQQVTNGVFTASYPNRDNGTGIWKVTGPKHLAEPKKKLAVFEDDALYLESCFPQIPKEGLVRQGFLVTHGDVKTTLKNHGFDDSKKLVFTNSKDIKQPSGDNGKWTVEINHKASITPVNTYYIWVQEEKKWVDYGAFELHGEADPIVGLILKDNKDDETNEGESLVGSVSYRGQSPQSIELKRNETETEVYFTKKDVDPSNFKWVLGGRQDKRVVEIDVSSFDNGKTLVGKIEYAGGAKMPLKGLTANVTWIDDEPKKLLHDFFQLDTWNSRIKRINRALETAVSEFDTVLETLDGISIQKIMDLISNAGGESYSELEKDYYRAKGKTDHYSSRILELYATIGDDDAIETKAENEAQTKDALGYSVSLDHLNKKVEALLRNPNLTIEITTANASTTDGIDHDFQLKQLLNLYTLSQSMEQFWEKLSSKSTIGVERLIQANMLPPVDLIRACFRQFTKDFEIFQNSLRQRRWVKSANDDSIENIQATSLIVTDKLAARAISPFKDLITQSEDFIPITFFSDRVFVRQMPYTDKFVFIGLSYDLTQPLQNENPKFVPFELLAIPHEIGHYIYRYVKLTNLKSFDKDNRELKNITFEQLTKAEFQEEPYYRWCEEIFADLYGCFIAGPFAVLGMQALIATEDKHMVIDDDDEHPNGIFRPYFLSEMLRKLSSLDYSDQFDFHKIATLLDANWTAILERWGYVVEYREGEDRPFRINLLNEAENYEESFVNLDKAIELLEPIMDRYARELVDHIKSLKNNDKSFDIPWCAWKEAANGQQSESDSLAFYIEGIRSLTDYKNSNYQTAGKHLSSKAQIADSLNVNMDDVLKGRIEHLGRDLYQLILIGWGDKGPHGTGVHD